MQNKKLIFDLGFHVGDDTNFYLQKGFKVIAVEANPFLVEKGKNRFANHIKEGNLILINKVISKKYGKNDFYINQDSPNLSSIHHNIAKINSRKITRIKVETTNLVNLCGEFGVPLYVKTDIEGADHYVAEDLFHLDKKPKYVSFEISRTFYKHILSYLYISGYQEFQLINQMMNPTRKGDFKFSEHSSGPFGSYLQKNKWVSFDEVLSRYIKYKDLRTADEQELALGWLDVHAKL